MFDFKISIIIPIYNVEKYLAECIDSVINQTYKNLEIILVDDGSPDNSGRICDEYAENYKEIKVIHKENGGLSSARKAGIEIANGDYVMFLDGDDWLDTCAVEKCVGVVYKNRKIDCVLFSYVKEFPNSSVPMQIFDNSIFFDKLEVEDKIYRRLFGLLNDELKHPERMENLVSCGMKLYKRELLLKAKFFDTELVGSCEDGLFNMYALYDCENMYYIDEPFYHYRKNNTSITNKYRPNFIQQWNTLFSIMENIIVEKNLPDKYQTALNNRISLSVTAIGLNEYRNGFFNCIKKLNSYLKTEKYKKAIKKFDISSVPILWKILMICSKYKLSILVAIGLAIIDKMRKGRN